MGSSPANDIGPADPGARARFPAAGPAPASLDVRAEKSFPPFLLSVDLNLPATGVTVVFGPSGAGKTTLLNIIAGLERPDSGRVVHRGRVLFDASRGVCLPPERRGLGCVFQQPRLFSHLSVRSNLEFGPRFGGRPKRPGALEAVVELLGIGHLLGRRPNTLSGGERQRVSIGRALMAGPSLLLMDEPLASLDRARKTDLVAHIARIPERLGVAVLYVTHAEDELEALADRVLRLEDGRGHLGPPPGPQKSFSLETSP
jgi:molybdate transport system ATP-binding protein